MPVRVAALILCPVFSIIKNDYELSSKRKDHWSLPLQNDQLRPHYVLLQSLQHRPQQSLLPIPHVNSHLKNIKKAVKAWKHFQSINKTKTKKKTSHGLEEDVCRVSEVQVEKALGHSKTIWDLKFLLDVKSMDGKDVEHPVISLKKRVL